ncbi:MAG: CHAD domain-containing protein [Rhodocyclaceae bacterium]|nr:MAG: CHAD domain-containing protein [Rhodocyclaceae bacterium]
MHFCNTQIDMADEIELKLALPKAAQALLLRQSVLRKAVSKATHQLVNLYYDTPGLALHKRGIALRLRKRGRTWLQTVKCAGSSAAGLTTRPEWEAPYLGHFDFAGVDAPAIRRWLERPELRKQITPLFETNFKRTTWRFEPRPGCVILLMLDRGWVAAAGKLEEISEVEIELAGAADGASIDELFTLAQTLGVRLPLMPAILSKAERGYRLYRGLQPTPQKGRIVPLASNDAPLEAFRKIALATLEHLQGNLHGAIKSNDPEFIHQMRVATRRLRAALRLFAPLLPAGLAEELVPELRTLTTRLGQARDLDVLLTEIATPVMRALPDEPRLAALAGAITDRQYSARAAAVRHLQSIAHGRLVLQATALLHRPPFLVPVGGAAGLTETVGDFAAARLKRLRKKVLGLAAAASIDDPASLHSLRIGIKRLRYALEFFSPLAAGRPLQRLLARLVQMQDELGQLNDLANAGLLLMNCAGDDSRLREAVSLVGGWHASRHKALLDQIPGQLKKLTKLKLPPLD